MSARAHPIFTLQLSVFGPGEKLTCRVACKPLLSMCSKVICQLSCSGRQSFREIAHILVHPHSLLSWSWAWPPRSLSPKPRPFQFLLLSLSLSLTRAHAAFFTFFSSPFFCGISLYFCFVCVHMYITMPVIVEHYFITSKYYLTLFPSNRCFACQSTFPLSSSQVEVVFFLLRAQVYILQYCRGEEVRGYWYCTLYLTQSDQEGRISHGAQFWLSV